MPSNFAFDGCTLFVQRWRGVNLRLCCDVHDEALYYGSGARDFLEANYLLAKCFFEAGVWELVIPAFIATSTVGVVFYVFGPKSQAKNGGRGT